MKTKLIALLLSVFAILTLDAQTVNDIPISEIDAEYVLMAERYHYRRGVTSISIDIDFGQEMRLRSLSQNVLVKEENGERLHFNSTVDALNFFSKHGYELAFVYATNETPYFILKRTHREE
jgi:hypothetical protein